ncbi:late secretory pathway protein avl9 [Physocladia obscura]|uniref:Late secretory pathway protein avl9 n=1 Tax=Physocladia obscura TaxID=109957 RepID=A0AAD5TB89_9FUNG|nr:late secretory pathway protein avl9 [Physocladia obscura]
MSADAGKLSINNINVEGTRRTDDTSLRSDQDNLETLSKLENVMARETKSSKIIKHVMCVTFHHRNGPQVEYMTPPFPGREAMIESFEIDGSRTAVGLPDECHSCVFQTARMLVKKNLFTFIYRLFLDGDKNIQAHYSALRASVRFPLLLELLVKTADITRSTVQKALVVLATEPVLGSVRTKLGLVTQAFFGQRDFSKMDIVETLYASLDVSMHRPISDSTLYSGISLRELVNTFKQKTLQLFKLLLLEKRVLFYGPKVEALSSYQYSLISLMPDLLRHLHDVGAPILVYSQENSVSLSETDAADSFRRKLASLGLPLKVFGEGAFFQPYIPLQQIDVLMSPETKSYLVGTSNSIFLHNKHAAIDAIVNCEKGTIEVIDPVLISAMQLTSADKRFIDVTSTWTQEDDPTLNQQMEYEGSDEDIRTRFESYLFSFLVSAKLTLFPIEISPVLPDQVPAKSKDYLSDFNQTWISCVGIGPGHLKEVPSAISMMSAQLQQFSWSTVIPPQTVTKAISTATATADSVKFAVVTAAESQQAKNLQSGASQMIASVSGWMRKREWSSSSSTRSSDVLNAALSSPDIKQSQTIETVEETNENEKGPSNPSVGTEEAFVVVKKDDIVEDFQEVSFRS